MDHQQCFLKMESCKSDRQHSHYTIAAKSVLALCGMGSINITLLQRSQCWLYVGWAVLTLHYCSEVSVGFMWDGQHLHYTITAKFVLGFRHLHYVRCAHYTVHGVRYYV